MRAQLAKLKTLKRGLKDSRGAAALEFALVAGPLIMLIFGCIELALIILLSVTLDNATDMAARGIRTGATTGGNTTQIQFRNNICSNMGWLQDSCTDNLRIEVQTFKSFGEVKPPEVIVDGKFIEVLPYNIGVGSDIQMVTAYYEWPLFTPFLSAGLTTLGNHDAVISSSSVFKNEPF